MGSGEGVRSLAECSALLHSRNVYFFPWLSGFEVYGIGLLPFPELAAYDFLGKFLLLKTEFVSLDTRKDDTVRNLNSLIF